MKLPYLALYDRFTMLSAIALEVHANAAWCRTQGRRSGQSDGGC